MTAHERYSERLGQNVHRYLRIPGAADQERQDRLRMTVIELRDVIGAQRHRKSRRDGSVMYRSRMSLPFCDERTARPGIASNGSDPPWAWV